MESFAIEMISNGGAIAVLFVMILFTFGYCYFKFKSIEIRLQDGDNRMGSFQNEISAMAKDVAFIRGLLEGKDGDK